MPDPEPVPVPVPVPLPPVPVPVPDPVVPVPVPVAPPVLGVPAPVPLAPPVVPAPAVSVNEVSAIVVSVIDESVIVESEDPLPLELELHAAKTIPEHARIISGLINFIVFWFNLLIVNYQLVTYMCYYDQATQNVSHLIENS